MNPIDVGTWSGKWAWGLPLIVLTVVMHVCGLGLIHERVSRVLSWCSRAPRLPAQVRRGHGRDSLIGHYSARS